MAEMPKGLSLSLEHWLLLAADLLRLPYGLRHDIQFSIIGPGSVPGSSLQAGMAEVEHVCSDSTGMSDAASMETQLSVSSTVPFHFRISKGPEKYPSKEGLRMGCCSYS